jgi:hypothetical protein
MAASQQRTDLRSVRCSGLEPWVVLVARDEEHLDVLVELDVHGAHLALGIVDFVDALFLPFQPRATERAFIMRSPPIKDPSVDVNDRRIVPDIRWE